LLTAQSRRPQARRETVEIEHLRQRNGAVGRRLLRHAACARRRAHSLLTPVLYDGHSSCRCYFVSYEKAVRANKNAYEPL
jgi:hypothetical protein